MSSREANDILTFPSRTWETRLAIDCASVRWGSRHAATTSVPAAVYFAIDPSITSTPLSVDHVEKELLHTRIARLAKPEDRFLAQLGVLVVLRDVHQLVDCCGLIVSLRENEDHLLLHLLIIDP